MKRLQWLGILMVLLVSSAAHADVWPSKMVKAVIPFGAGSAADVILRSVLERLSTELGQPVMIENRAGAGGTIGTGMVARAEPDGYTMLVHSSAHVIAPAIYPDLQYDPNKDFASALMVGYSANVMIVPPSRPWKTVQDFLTAAKAKDAALTFGSVGVGSATHISGEKFRLAAGFKATHIPYRGGSEVMTDILGGRIDFYFCPLATALPLIREGQVRALLVSTLARVPELPDVPTPADIGFPEAESLIWFGAFMPSKTPRDVVEKFHATGTKVLASPEMQKSLQKLAVTAWPMTPAQMDDLVAREIKANIALIKAAGIN